MRYDDCPVCGDSLSDMWRRGRKLRQECHNCDWVGEERTPELQPIKTARKVLVSQHGGFTFEVFDRYGHALMSSRSYSDYGEAKEALRRELAIERKDADPCTGVLWPKTVIARGVIIR